MNRIAEAMRAGTLDADALWRPRRVKEAEAGSITLQRRWQPKAGGTVYQRSLPSLIDDAHTRQGKNAQILAHLRHRVAASLGITKSQAIIYNGAVKMYDIPGLPGQAEVAVLAPYAAAPVANNGQLSSAEIDAILAAPASALTRPRGSADPRCHGTFTPDDWQVELMNAVDANKSVLVSAPTSSGKTFIAYYAMERVLMSSPDAENKIIYVAPTKALVNQIEAGIEARYKKKYLHPASNVLVGTFTGDFQKDLSRCQILVVTPPCLEILLLDPQFSQNHSSKHWRHALKYVIFDEIHRLGTEDGRLWERVVALVKCPFLALSATMGGLETFKGWLAAAEESKEAGRQVVTIEMSLRYNDLDINHYVCDNSEPQFSPLGRPEAGADVVRANALACLMPIQLRNAPTLAAIKLIPEDIVQIIQVLGQSVVPEVQVQCQALEALKMQRFGAQAYLTTADAALFEQDLKDVVHTLANSPAPETRGEVNHAAAVCLSYILTLVAYSWQPCWKPFVPLPHHGLLIVRKRARLFACTACFTIR